LVNLPMLFIAMWRNERQTVAKRDPDMVGAVRPGEG
jgi:hypothetical protein